MALSNSETRIMKVVQAIHHQGDITYGMLGGGGIHCSYVTYISLLDIVLSL